MFGNIFRVFKRNFKIQQITQKLDPGGDPTKFGDVRQKMAKLEEALQELVCFLKEDQWVTKLLETYHVNDEELKRIYFKLAAGTGTCVYVRGVWLPILALQYPNTLLYVLKHKDADDSQFQSVRLKLRQYFENGETGQIAD